MVRTLNDDWSIRLGENRLPSGDWNTPTAKSEKRARMVPDVTRSPTNQQNPKVQTPPFTGQKFSCFEASDFNVNRWKDDMVVPII